MNNKSLRPIVHLVWNLASVLPISSLCAGGRSCMKTLTCYSASSTTLFTLSISHGFLKGAVYAWRGWGIHFSTEFGYRHNKLSFLILTSNRPNWKTAARREDKRKEKVCSGYWSEWNKTGEVWAREKIGMAREIDGRKIKEYGWRKLEQIHRAYGWQYNILNSDLWHRLEYVVWKHRNLRQVVSSCCLLSC